ncbi:MAG: TonB-dependent receptor [Brevundimonas sp.]|uniref:TonB-dependent receptor n=1 Tax=Brevundimonas sp. TaxID=1871086 RepID=UPI00391DB953
MRFTKLLTTSASAIVLTAVAATGAAAQEVTSVDEIIVTAQKREQSLQDVPIVVTSLSQQVLENAGVRDIKDMTILTPGLTVTSTTSETITTARIRGVGTVGDNPGLESSVGIVIDGVYRPRNGVGFGDLGEMSRIEVLKGPQGTLFGKNTSAGVINIVTEAPSFQPGFNGELTAGNFGALGASMSVTGPLSENIAGRLYVASRERDGFYDVNTTSGPRTATDDQNQDFWTVRGQLLILPSDEASIRLIADYTKRDEYCCVATQVRTGPTGAIINALAPGGNGVVGPQPGFAPNPFTRSVNANRPTDQQVEDWGLSAEVNVDTALLGGSTLTSITAFRGWDSVNGSDIDFSGADLFYRSPDGNFGFSMDQWSQELRLAGSSQNFDWLVGMFYAEETLRRQDSFIFGPAFTPFFSTLITSQLGAPDPNALPCITADPITFAVCTGALAPFPGFVPNFGPTVPAGSGYLDRYSQSSDSIAFFTNNSWRATDALEFTLGLRYTREEKVMHTLQNNIGGGDAGCTAVRNNPFAPPALLGGALCINQLNPDFDGRAYTQVLEDDDISGRFAVQYRFNPELMVYGSYARGYKAGGFNLERSSGPNPARPGDVLPIDDTSFPAETVDSWELGFKSTLLNRQLLFNATWFHQTFSDFQLNTFAGINFIVESIPELTSTGVDADLLWLTPVEGLTLTGGVTYAQTEYGDFTAADLSDPSRFPALSLLPGAQMSFAPEWSLTAGVNYDRSLGGGLRGLFSLSAKYTSEYNTGSDLLPLKMNDAMTLVNGRIGIGSEDDRWTLEIWGQNLTDEEYAQVVFNGPLQGNAFQATPTASGPYAGTFYNPAADTLTYNAFLGAPRTWGVTLRVRY